MPISDYVNVFVLDFGVAGTKATMSKNGRKSKYISHKDVLDLPNIIPPHSLIVAEHSHLGCARKDFSLSQPYYENELLDFYERCHEHNIKIKLFPEKLMPRAIASSGLKKSNENDPISMFILLKKNPRLFDALMKPKLRHLTSNTKWDNWKSATNKILNIARITNYDFDGNVNDQNTIWLLENLEKIYENLSDRARNCFGFQKYKKTNKLKIKTKNNWQFNMCQVYSILSSIRNFDGLLRLNENGGFPRNYHFKRYIACMTPYHFKGGVLRSNLMHHGMRNFICAEGKKTHETIDEKGKITSGPADFKRKVKRGNEYVAINRGNFTNHEDQTFLCYRKIYVKSAMELYLLFKTMLREDAEKQKQDMIMEPTF